MHAHWAYSISIKCVYLKVGLQEIIFSMYDEMNDWDAKIKLETF